VGTIVEVLKHPKVGTRYVVECTAPDGSTVWLGEFLPDELRPEAP
jgi:hypothetical protein